MDSTRRSFIRGIASAGASSVAAVALERTGYLDTATALAQTAPPSDFSAFRAIAASAADAFEVPEGYRARTIIGYGDQVLNEDGTVVTYGYNNDFLAYFPLNGLRRGPAVHQSRVPGAVLPARRDRRGGEDERPGGDRARGPSATRSCTSSGRADGGWSVVSPSRYNRRITGAGPVHEFTGPAGGQPGLPGHRPGRLRVARELLGRHHAVGHRAELRGELPGLHRLRLGPGAHRHHGLHQRQRRDRRARRPSTAGCASTTRTTRASSAASTPRSVASGTRTRLSAPSRTSRSCSTWATTSPTAASTSSSPTSRSGRAGARRTCASSPSGTLYIAYWAPQSRRTFDAPGGNLTSPTGGTGTWREVQESELVDTNARIAAAVGALRVPAALRHQPPRGRRGRRGRHGLHRADQQQHRQRHARVDPAPARGRQRSDRAAVHVGRTSPRAAPPAKRDPGQQGFSSPDNIVFDKAGNLWVVTDISSSVLNNPANPNAYHRNNAVFMVPRTGPNAGIGVPLREHADRGRGHRSVLHAGRADVVRQRPASGRGDADGGQGRRVRRREHVHLLLAQGQQDARARTRRRRSRRSSRSPRSRPARRPRPAATSSRPRRPPRAPTARRRAWRSCPPPVRALAR